jgi:lipoprotein-releasing system permease protein
MALVIALALMTGLQTEMRDRLLGATAHVFVAKAGGFADYRADVAKLVKMPHVVGAAPTIIGQGLIINGDRQKFLSIKGIDPALERRVTDIGGAIKAGRLSDVLGGDPDAPPGLVIGRDLAQELHAAVGDTVRVLTPQATLGPGFVLPRSRLMRIVGIFSLGFYEFDSSYGFVSLPVAERLLNVAQPTYIELRVDDIYRAPQVAADVTGRLGDLYVADDWSTMNKSLFSALWLEKMAISITIGLIVMVAALNIVASLILLVMEKHRDIAILKTMGASARSVMTIFMLQGLLIGAVGTAIGGGGGWILARVLDTYRLIHLPGDVYQVSYVPFLLQPLDFAVVIAAAVFICFAATIYPARQAAKLEPAEALRYE